MQGVDWMLIYCVHISYDIMPASIHGLYGPRQVRQFHRSKVEYSGILIFANKSSLYTRGNPIHVYIRTYYSSIYSDKHNLYIPQSHLYIHENIPPITQFPQARALSTSQVISSLNELALSNSLTPPLLEMYPTLLKWRIHLVGYAQVLIELPLPVRPA